MSSEVTIIPMMAAMPHSHMGHRYDLGEKLRQLPGYKIVGLSDKNDVLTAEERMRIISSQWDGGWQPDRYIYTNSAGKIAALAREHGKVLHILVGHDRFVKLGVKFKEALENGKIKEMEGRHFDCIHIHTPENDAREHGLSGTKMRQAIADENFEEYLRHFGEYSLYAEYVYSVILRPAYMRGDLIVKRKK